MKRASAFEVRQNFVALLVSATGFIVCAILAQSNWIEPVELWVLRLIYGVSGTFAPLVYGITQMGSVGAWLVLVCMAIALRRKQIAAVLFTNGLLAYAVASMAKFMVARPRPSVLYPDIVVRLEVGFGYGFPSGHTAIATALALGLHPYISKKYHWILWAWIIAVGLSRVYLGVHAPLDVVGGFCIGVAIASATRLAVLSYTQSSKKA